MTADFDITSLMSDGSILEQPQFLQVARELADTVRFLAGRGWTPATSSNFSARLGFIPDRFAISRSGVDKYAFTPADLMVVDGRGRAIEPERARPSAETPLHTLLYEDGEIGAVLHTHSVRGTVLSMRHAADGKLVFSGYEILKGLAGNHTHLLSETLPIFPNSQDMVALSHQVREYWKREPGIHGFLIEGHGLYCWGRHVSEARRHVETLEFLMECFKMSG